MLAFHSKRATDMSTNVKLAFKWLGPYKVQMADQIKGYYILVEMDGTRLKGTYAGNRLKKFIQMDGAYRPLEPDSAESSTEPGSLEGSDSWERDNADDEILPRATVNTRSRYHQTNHASSTQIAIIPPTLTDSQKAQYTAYTGNDGDDDTE